MFMNTQKATEILRSFFRDNKRLPSYQEMCSLFGYASKRSVHQLVQKLIDMGILDKDSSGKIIPKKLTSSLPVLGAVQAGYPTMAEEAYFGRLSLEEYVVPHPANSYVLKVKGDSMIDAGIHEGDLVIVESCEYPKEGDIVVAYIDDAFTLKFFHKEGTQIRLVPANKNYPILYPHEHLEIHGKVVSVIRSCT